MIRVDCKTCHGSGYTQQTDVDFDTCRVCDGSGEIEVIEQAPPLTITAGPGLFVTRYGNEYFQVSLDARLEAYLRNLQLI